MGQEEYLLALESLLSITEGFKLQMGGDELREWSRISAWMADMRSREFDEGEM